MNRSTLMHDKNFHALLALVSVAFGWVLWPFWGAVFWGTVLAILFSPVQRRLVVRLRGRRNLAALLTVLLVLLVAILPLAFIAGSLVNEGALLYQSLRSGSLDFGAYVQQVQAALPGWLHDVLAHFDLYNLDSLRNKLSQGAMQASRFLATKAFSIGQDTFQFVINLGIMLYLLFFLLRDGPGLSRRMLRAIPLSDEHKEPLMQKFTTVVRATVKGNVAVAAAQGVLGGFIFWALGIQGALLWGVVMGFLSLLPAVGSALVWVPVAVYFLLTGALWQGIVLVLFCVLIIGMVDNFLRPLLVGKETKLPDYVILISTLGGMALVGLNGFVIGPLVAALFMAAWDLFSPHED
ncbi:AI-2E family transporter [Bordetella sp. FB-8]|uniref:AI-2E family transporter n=1 Tax=Bordetella sp. FB-8 TaxID=1159870 RepID=UPI00037D0178|nr:AI-2E family transporter [Bordetella sp. FB-8]